jgi:hypothetical protein
MGLTLRGINYDTGTEFSPNDITRENWKPNDIKNDFKLIREELNCNTINLYGTNSARLLEAVEFALAQNLIVSVQLRSIDKTKKEMISEVSTFSEKLNKFEAPNNLILNIGCESSLFTQGFVPGKTFLHRMMNMIWIWPLFSLINHKLAEHLNLVVKHARNHFSGKLIYSSGSWETIDWTNFDYIGINLYRDRENYHNYVDIIKNLTNQPKPVIITEFGCSTFKGASFLGGGGWTIVDYKKQPPQLKKIVDRDEKEQADLLCELIEIYNRQDIYGCYVFDFIEIQQLYSSEPRFDLDRASYGIVKAFMDDQGSIQWQKKLAYTQVAEAYKRIEMQRKEETA